jgi:predicted nuclease of predicted toxin-antitoxin system
MRFLLDECITPNLVTIARQAGFEAYHVVHVGKAGWKDWNVFRHAIEGDFVLVTNNASDFRRLYASAPLHVGLVLLLPSVERPIQQRLFKNALDELRANGELINQVLEVGFDGDEVTLLRSDLPAARS